MFIYSGAPAKSVLSFPEQVSFFDRNNCPFISRMGVRNEPVYATIKPDQINLIKILWEQLNKLHLHNSKFFKNHFKTYTFEDKCKNFSERASDEIQITVLYDNEKAVGYCISTISDKIGEIDSLFIDEEYRKYGYGKILVEKSMRWFEMNKCEKIHLSVAEGNESVFGFYEKFGFYPRFTSLILRKPL